MAFLGVDGDRGLGGGIWFEVAGLTRLEAVKVQMSGSQSMGLRPECM